MNIISLLVYNSISFTYLKKLLITEKSWWVKKSLLKFIDPNFFGQASFKELFEIIICDENLDVSLCGALELINNNIEPTNSQSTMNYHAQIALKKMGLVSRVKSKPSIIGAYLSNICNSKIKPIDWKNFLE